MRRSFKQILEDNRVVVPIIQRDYAQGRIDDRTTEIRSRFLDAIFDNLQKGLNGDIQAVMELDFIYGYREEGLPNRFYPIDGQQRLTTLWLLYWFVGRFEQVEPADRAFLNRFTYETRHSTDLFCKALCNFQPTFQGDNISKEIRDQQWYFEAWDFDPSIRAMLVTLNAIEVRYKRWNMSGLWQLLVQDVNPMVMYMLDMGRVGLADDLYIKMNSRGKPLTEFEYFKVGFLEIISNPSQKERFEKAIDGKWAEWVWSIATTSILRDNKADKAKVVDGCFLRLLNFLTDIIAAKAELPFSTVTDSMDELRGIYGDKTRLDQLFHLLDVLSDQAKENPQFWDDHFYYDAHLFSPEKVRLYFSHGRVNLAEACMFNYEKSARGGFSFPEQLLLYGCILSLQHPVTDFSVKLRVLRNLAVNSGDRLRQETIVSAFTGIDQYLLENDSEGLGYFKTLQVSEEKKKREFLIEYPVDSETLYRLEDSDVFRGSVSVIEFNDRFGPRASVFLKIFDEKLDYHQFIERANLLLCFGDYTQGDGHLTNVLDGRIRGWRNFFVAPGYHRDHFKTKTRPVLAACLDFFIEHPDITVSQKLKLEIEKYERSPKDWRFYFLQYHLFRRGCNQGYYMWETFEKPYCCAKMKERQRNGYHWDPFLQVIHERLHSASKRLKLANYGNDLEVTFGATLLEMSVVNDGYLLKDNDGNEGSVVLQKLVELNLIDQSYKHAVPQNDEGTDMEDRIELGIQFVRDLLAVELE